LTLALGGDSAQAARLANDLAKRFPQNTLVQVEALPMIRASIMLSGGNKARNAPNALEVLNACVPYELGQEGLLPIYLRGQAYLAARRGAAAAAEFQRILDHPGLVLNSVVGALAHLGLGRAYALAGDTAKARAAYQDFLTLWKDADPDTPVFLQAKAEYANLLA